MISSVPRRPGPRHWTAEQDRFSEHPAPDHVVPVETETAFTADPEDGELVCVLSGKVELSISDWAGGQVLGLEAGDCCTVPAGATCRLRPVTRAEILRAGTRPRPQPDVRGRLLALTDWMWPHAVRAAVGLRLAELLAKGGRTAAELAAESGADAVALDRLMRYLVCRGVFARGPGGYVLGNAATVLRRTDSSRLAGYLDPEGTSGRSERVAAGLLEAVRTGGAVYSLMFGQPFWDDLAANPSLRESFDTSMADYTARWTAQVLDGFPWPETGRLVDVGGGDGTMLARVLLAHPHLHGTLVDLPTTVKAVPDDLGDPRLDGRCAVIAGDFFGPLPTGADLYLLCNVLNDWADPDAETIVRRCAEAAGPGGRVLIAESHPVSEREFTLTDLLVLVLLGGRLRTGDALADLVRTAGMTPAEPRVSPSGVVLVEGTVPS